MSEKNILDSLQNSKDVLSVKYYSLRNDQHSEVIKNELYKIITDELKIISNIADNMKENIRAGYHSSICRAVDFLKEAKESYEKNDLKELINKTKYGIDKLDDIIKRWNDQIILENK